MTNVTDNGTNVIPLDDSRKKLEADVWRLAEGWRKETGFWNVYSSVGYAQIIDLLDRQDAITQRDCIDRWDAKALALYTDAETARKALAEECEEWGRVCDKVKAERDELLRKSKEFEQTIAELHGAVCERDGRIGTYERRNTELNDALKAICNRYGVSTQWAAEDAAKKVFESIDSAYMRLPVDANGVPWRIGDEVQREDKDRPNVVTGIYFYGDGNHALHVRETACTAWTPPACKCRHVRQDTVEDLLEEFYGKTHATTAEEREELAAEYAERIRRACQ